MRRPRKVTILVGVFVLAAGLSTTPAFAVDEDGVADQVPEPQSVPERDDLSAFAAGGADADDPGTSENSTAEDLGYTADDPEWVDWVAQFDGIDWETEWQDIDWDGIEPLPTEAASTDETGRDAGAMGGPDDIPFLHCGWWWVLDWPISGGPDDPLPVDYGAGGRCNFPDVGFPSWDMWTQAQLLDASGRQVDLSPIAYNAWDCLDCDGVSSDTVNVDWPGTWEIDAHGAIMLYPGCDPSGCGDPADWWVWLNTPPECQGAGTPVLRCDFTTGEWHIGETVCGDSWSGGSDGASASVITECNGSGIDVYGTVRLDNDHPDHCAYVWAWFADGSTEWAGTCDPGGLETFDWTHGGKVVQLTSWSEVPA